MKATEDPSNRYLSLTGVIFELNHVDNAAFPALEKLKRDYFHHHPDEPIILHRSKILMQTPPFHPLRNPVKEKAFYHDLLQILRTLDYTVITAVIDKWEHKQQYTAWQFDPYHYALTMIIERYVQWLKRKSAVGDVMAESRGGKEDRRLKASFDRVYEKGTDYVSAEDFAAVLTSHELKVKPKISNIAGLQVADLIAHPSYRAVLAWHDKQALGAFWGVEIAQLLINTKYLRSPSGKIDGWGRKWLP